ncbi:Putative NUDIX hydrolase domain-containing protein [Colletotrichum destructivum]|uniref:NUDIX hydrolase domain-containing protein n=1 Tax=Colletotrichum destructivum TaxID=34406 RepID=A0AAX4HWK4_9PEZI|nr:Putative NUDIX hydrolase domain-containing protein [Colletotrichum destructivum]
MAAAAAATTTTATTTTTTTTTPQQPAPKMPPPAFDLTYPPSLEPYNTPAHAWLAANAKSWDGLATSALVFDRRGRVLLVQRAAHDSMPLRWETPGGRADDDDASLLVACARELWEEAGLEAVEVVRVVSEGAAREPGSLFTNRTGTAVYCRFAFEVRVRETGDGAVDGDGDELEVRIDPDEHADYVWASEEEVRRERVGDKEIPITNGQMARLILDGFWRRREEPVEDKREVVQG